DGEDKGYQVGLQAAHVGLVVEVNWIFTTQNTFGLNTDQCLIPINHTMGMHNQPDTHRQCDQQAEPERRGYELTLVVLLWNGSQGAFSSQFLLCNTHASSNELCIACAAGKG